MNLKDTISFNPISPVFGVYLHMLVALFYLLGIHNIFASHKYIHQTCIQREIPPQTYVLVCSGFFDFSFFWHHCDQFQWCQWVPSFNFIFTTKCEWILRLIDSVAQLIHPAVISKKYEIWSGPGPVMYADPKIAKILVLGDSVPEIRPKNRFWVIFGPFFGFFQNPVKSIWL